MASKLTKMQKWMLAILIVLYWGAVQFISLTSLEYNAPNVVNPFQSRGIQIVIMNLGVVLVALVLLVFQAFIYRLILRLLKVKWYPSMMKSLFYIVVGYIPFIVVTNLVFYLLGVTATI